MRLFCFLLLTAVAAVFPACIRAADTTDFAAGIAEAKKENRDVLVYFTGSDWCAPAVKFKAEILDAGGVREKLGDAFVFTVIDRRADATPDIIETGKIKNKELKFAPFNYPEIVLVDTQGRIYAHIDCRRDAPKTPAEFLKKIEVARDAKAKCHAAFAEAEKLSGTDKALALGRGLDALAPKIAATYKAEIDAMKKADPEDKSGCVAKYTFNSNSLAEFVAKAVADKKPEDVLPALAKLLANDKLTHDQKMDVRAAKAAFYREQNKQPEMLAALREVVAADPAHGIAKGAQGYLDFLEKPVVLPNGRWSHACCRVPGVWIADVAGIVKTAGRHEVVMEHTAGHDWQRISEVSLVAGDKVLATKKTNERVGPDNKRLAWEFDLTEAPTANVTVRISVNSEGAHWVSEGLVSAKKLPAEIDSALAAPVPAKTGDFALELARAELMRLVGTDGMNLVLKKKNGAAFSENFLNNRAWLEKFLVSGPVDAGVPAAEGLAVLCELWNFDRAGVEGKFNSLATAVALNYAAMPFRADAKSLEIDPFRPTTPIDRYAFYRDASNAGRLDAMFAALRAWELRFVVGAPLDNDALRWALDNINVPLRDYPEAYTMTVYRRINSFGDTVHRPLYYMPWRATENRMISILERGGVCGSLSTFGATAAQAHGIPAYPAGQPGHCAYAVRLAPGKWTGGTFGAHAGTPLHYFWGQSTYYTVLMEDAFADDAKILDSMRNVWIARRLLENGKFDVAKSACLSAIAAQPANFDAWTLRIGIAEKNPETTLADWQKIADDIPEKLPNHMRPACDLLTRFEGKLLAGKTPAEKVAWFTRVHETLARTKGEISWHWRVDELIGKQVMQLPADTDDRWALFKKAVALHVRTSDEFLGQLLDWGVKNLGDAGAAKSIQALADVVNEGGDTINEKSAEKILGTALLAAAKAKSLPAFQAAAKVAGKYAQPTIHFKLERPEGLKVVSADGLLSTSSTTPWDAPLTHGNVLTEKGGLFHTGAQKTPSATVQLNGAKKLTGILIVNREQYPARAKPLIVSTSTDGATWTKIWESHEVKPQWFIPLQDKGVTAVYVKVASQHDVKDYFHLRAIVVYGE